MDRKALRAFPAADGMPRRAEADLDHKWDPAPEWDPVPAPVKRTVPSRAREPDTDWSQDPIPRKTYQAECGPAEPPAPVWAKDLAAAWDRVVQDREAAAAGDRSQAARRNAEAGTIDRSRLERTDSG